MPFQADTATLSQLTIASQDQMTQIENEIHRLQSAIAGKSMYAADPLASPVAQEPNLAPAYMDGGDVALPDIDLMMRNLQADQETLKVNSPPDLTGTEKNALYQYYKEMSRRYAEGLLSHGQMREATSSNVEQFMLHQQQYAEVGMALRNVIRILDPSEPFSIDALRPTQPNYRNMAAWYEKFDQIKWGDEQEIELQRRNIDDQTYHPFVVLQARGVDKSVIMQKLSMSQVLYEACMARLKDEIQELEADLPRAPQVHDIVPEASEHETLPAETEEEQAEAIKASLRAEIQKLTHYEQTMVSRHATHMARLVGEGKSFYVKQARAATGTSVKECLALLRGMVKTGFLHYNQDEKLYTPIRLSVPDVAPEEQLGEVLV